MKKIFRVFLLLVGVILLLLIMLPVLFKSRIETMVKEKVNQEIHATVNWSRFSLSFFRGFPDLSVNLHKVSVVGLDPFIGDTLVGLKRFELRVNPFSAMRKELQVKSVLLNQALINGIVLKDGKANWDIAPVHTEDNLPELSETGSGEDAALSMGVSLKRFAIRGGRFYYNDQTLDLNASMEDLNLVLSGDFSMDQTQLALQVDIGKINAKKGGIRFMKDGALGMDLLLAANMVDNIYTLKKNEITLNGLVLGAEGKVALLDEGAMDVDLRFFSKETTFQTLLSMVPAIYMRDFETLKTSGTLKLEGSVHGIMKDTLLPDANLVLQVSDGYFSYPDLPEEVSDVQIKLNIDYNGKNMDATTVDLEQFHLLLGGNPFDMKLKLDHPISDMHVAGEAFGVIDFSSLQDVVPLDEISLTGRLETNLKWDTRMSFIEHEQFDRVNLDGTFWIEKVHLEAPGIPVPIQLTEMKMEFNPRYVTLLTLDMILGSSDLHMDGKLSNFIPYLFNDQTVSGSLNISSDLLNANELLLAEIGEDIPTEQKDSMDTFVQDSLAHPANVKIPENIDFAMTLNMKKVIYERISMENISGNMKIVEGVAYLDELSLDVIDGHLTASGKVDTRGDFAEVDVSLDMKGIDIPAAYETFVTVERLAPMAKYCKGTANVNMQYQSMLDASFTPLYESIEAKGRMYTKGLQIYDLNSFVRLSELLKNDKFREMAPDEVNVGFAISEGRVIIDPFDMNIDASQMTVSGSHGIDMTLDYLLDMNIAKSDLGGGANDLMNGISLLAAGAGFQIPQSDYIKVKARIRGTFNEPKISTDLSENLKSSGETVKAVVEQKVMEEVKVVEEQVREEAGEKAEDIISDAEAEAEHLIEEAKKAGAFLVHEAEIQGENLIKEAGSGPLNQMAAKRAAKELKQQAVKQSENLVREAEEQADQIIEKARTEAEKI